MFRQFNKFRKLGDTDFVALNNKRIAEVWMEDYKKYVYKRNPKKYNDLDPGDLSVPLAVKKKLNCKPFKYFLEVVAPDLLEYYIYDPVQFAHGTIQLFGTNVCIDTLNRALGQSLGVYGCDADPAEPRMPQNFELTQYREIRLTNSNKCFDSYKFSLNLCHNSFGNQDFFYNHVKYTG